MSLKELLNRFAHRHVKLTALVTAELVLIAAATATVAWLGAHADAFPVESYFYLAKAKSLAAADWLRVPWNDGVDRHFHWGYSVALALPLKLFGDAAFWLLGAALVAWTGVVCGRILAMLPMTNAARLAALALALFSPLTLHWATVPVPEPLLLASAVTAVYFGLRYREGAGDRELLWAALFAGLCLSAKAEGFTVALVLAALCVPRLVREHRRHLQSIALVLLVAPEALHLLYLGWYALPARGVLAYLDELRGFVRAFDPLGTVMVHLRAPFWPIYRFNTEPWLLARFFPGWLAVAQGLIVLLYLAMLAFVLVSGFFRRAAGFVAAVGLVALALLHQRHASGAERFDILVVPAAALVFAWGIDGLVAWVPRRRLRAAFVLVVALGCAALGGFYGSRAAQLRVARLKLENSELDFRSIAASVNMNNPQRRAVATDLGPALAYYLDARSLFLRDSDLYDDAVPREDARAFLVDKGVAFVVSTRSERELERELGITASEYQRVRVPGVTLLVLDLAGPIAGRP